MNFRLRHLGLLCILGGLPFMEGQGHAQPFSPFVDELPIPPTIKIEGPGSSDLNITLRMGLQRSHSGTHY